MTGSVSVRPDWLAATRRYLVAAALGNLAWEIAQLPLYALWRTANARELAQAVLHCTAGDLVIASAALIIALAAVGTADWPARGVVAVTTIVVVLSVGYTAYSEYLNTVVRRSWTYTELMPTLPWLGSGLSPLMQSLVVPILSLMWSCGARNGAEITETITDRP